MLKIGSVIRSFLSGFKKNVPATDSVLEKIEQQLVFQKSKPLTIGIECEFGIVDNDTYDPAHVALNIVKALNNPFVHYELYQHMIELTSGVCTFIQEAEKDLTERLNSVYAALPQHKASLLGIGNLPFLMLEQLVPTETERYKTLRETRAALYERFTTLGMHIHIGMPDSAACFRFHNFYMHLLPHLLALSASSPFEFGKDTGLTSIRPSVTESMPIAGLPYQFTSWQEYKDLCSAMVRAGSINDLKDLWWDLRPCPRLGTLEIRICDQPPTLAEVMAIAAFVHCLGHWFLEHQGWLDEMPRPNNWRMRENKWRAMRFGLQASLVVNNQGDTVPIKKDILDWVERLQPYYKKFGYRPYQATLVNMLEKGNSASRQRRVFQATQDLKDVYVHCIEELRHGSPLWDRIETMEKAKNPDQQSA